MLKTLLLNLNRSDILHQTQPKSNVPSDLNDAQTKLSDIGLHHWRTVMGTMSNAPTSSQAPNTAFNILHEMTNINYRASMLGETNTVITPCKPPPSKRKVEQWWKRKHVETMQNSHEDKNGLNSAIANNEQVNTGAANDMDKFKMPAQAGKDGHKHSDKDQPSTSQQELPNKSDVSMETDATKTKDSTITSTPLPQCFASPTVRNSSLSHSTPVRGPSSQIATEPGVTPIAGCSSQRRRLSIGSQRSSGDGPLANLVRRQSLFFTPREVSYSTVSSENIL